MGRLNTSSRTLIVNADDFGLSPGVTRGIIHCFEHGIVTSTSFMTRGQSREEAAKYARQNPRLSVGLHIDLCEWVVIDGEWSTSYEVVSMNDPAAIADEVDRQLRDFRDLLGRDPSHLDSHQHVHVKDPVRSIMLECAAALQVPLRHVTNEATFVGKFYGQDQRGRPHPAGILVPGLIATISGLPAGVTELSCHPGFEENLASQYCAERVVELQSLCDPAVREAVEKLEIRLCTFNEIR